MKKVFLVMLEGGTYAFSRVPGGTDGMRRAPNFKKKTKESKSGTPESGSLPESGPDISQPST